MLDHLRAVSGGQRLLVDDVVADTDDRRARLEVVEHVGRRHAARRDKAECPETPRGSPAGAMVRRCLRGIPSRSARLRARPPATSLGVNPPISAARSASRAMLGHPRDQARRYQIVRARVEAAARGVEIQHGAGADQERIRPYAGAARRSARWRRAWSTSARRSRIPLRPGNRSAVAAASRVASRSTGITRIPARPVADRLSQSSGYSEALVGVSHFRRRECRASPLRDCAHERSRRAFAHFIRPASG